MTMTTKTMTEPQQYQQQYQNLAKASVVHTREYVQRLAEVNKEISEVLYQATGTAMFFPLPVPAPTQGLQVIFTFDSGDQLYFQGRLSGLPTPIYAECSGNATFFVSPDRLLQLGNVEVYIPPAEFGTNMNWLLAGFFLGGSIPVLLPQHGIGIFQK